MLYEATCPSKMPLLWPRTCSHHELALLIAADLLQFGGVP